MSAYSTTEGIVKIMLENTVKERRIGTFDISTDFVRNEPDVVMAIMSHMVVVRCECLMISDAFRYDAYSPLFEATEKCMGCPKYNIIITKNDGKIIVRAEKE